MEKERQNLGIPDCNDDIQECSTATAMTTADVTVPGAFENEAEPPAFAEPPLSKDCFIGLGNNAILPKSALVELGYAPMSKGTSFSDKYRFKWVQTAREINYMKFAEGKHIVNHFSNSNIFTNKVECMEMLADLNRNM